MLIGQKNLYCILFFFNFFFFVCIYIYIYIYIYYIYICVCVCVYIYMCVYVCIYVYIYLYMTCSMWIETDILSKRIYEKMWKRQHAAMLSKILQIIKVNFNAFILSFSFLISLFCATLFLYFEFHMTLEHIFQEE